MLHNGLLLFFLIRICYFLLYHFFPLKVGRKIADIIENQKDNEVRRQYFEDESKYLSIKVGPM